MLDQYLRSVRDNTKNVEYEILLNTSPGVLYEKINEEFEKSVGKYVVLMCDDCVVHKDWARKMIDFLEEEPPLTVGEFKIFARNRDSVRDLKKIAYYGHTCSIFPFVNREEHIVHFDYFLDPGLRRFYGDIDLCLRYWAAGGRISYCPAEITMFSYRDGIKKAAVRDELPSDEKYFNDKWRSHDFSVPSYKATTRTFSQAL